MADNTDVKPKRKTKTSSAVKRRYNSKTYSRVYADLSKDLVSNFKKLAQEQGVSVASVIKLALEQFLKETSERKCGTDVQNAQKL
jgi:putative cell wall-binding protein